MPRLDRPIENRDAFTRPARHPMKGARRGARMRLRSFNDFEHVAAWLSEKTGQKWQPIDVVDACVRHWIAPHIQVIIPSEFENAPRWLRNGDPATMIFHQDLPRFLAGEGRIEMLQGPDGKLVTFDPAIPADVYELRLSETAALTLLDRLICADAANGEVERGDEGRQRQQEAQVLKTLRDLGYDPLQLPKPPAGKPGPKSEARKALKAMTPTVFDKAWERLRTFKEIVDKS